MKQVTEQKKEKKYCAFHPESRVSHLCDYCNKPLCSECLISYKNVILCEICRKRVRRQMALRLAVAGFFFLFVSLLGTYSLLKLNERKPPPSQIRLIEKALRENPQDAKLIWRLSNLYRAAGKEEKSLKLQMGLLERYPQNIKIIIKVSVTLIRMKKYDKALAILEKGLLKNPNSVLLLKMQGIAWKNTGSFEECERSWMKAYRQAPGNIDLIIKLTDFLVEMDRYEDAARILRHSHNKVSREQRRFILKKLDQVNNKIDN
ncbi:MAG: hypothetical protein PF689_12810 [Deltaproteobacteria bacterium]|jgi:tetratricopeptide (TPR) repeat protein|nr:hypothetical protein [Deltaproteobacteria bacterium]